jgi:hypothetical protein
VTDHIAPILAKLARLEDIDLYCDRVGDATFAELAKLPQLRVLRAGRTCVTDVGVAHLAGKASLRELDLSRTAITDAAMHTIGGLHGLQRLRLGDVETISAVGIAELLRLHDLRSLHVPTLPDAEDVEAQLRSRFPRLWFDC